MHRLHPISIAPMMEWTDRHCRYFLRLISRQALLYTEMITTTAVLRGNRDRLLAYDPAEHPVALQLGGADPGDLAECARIAEAFGYDEVNLNVGCPSDRVQSGRFGACLMAERDVVARGVSAMAAAVDIPVSVKSRIGIDDQEEWPTLRSFVHGVAEAGCRRFIVHARKAWLGGLSPKENRTLPPLRYELVHRLKQAFPVLDITLNGGIRSLDDAAAHLARLDGIMLGREAYRNPWLLAEVDRRFYGMPPAVRERRAVVERMLPYIESECAAGTPLNAMTRHLLGLFQGVPGARAWRRHLSDNAHRPGAGAEIVWQTLALLPDAPILHAAE